VNVSQHWKKVIKQNETIISLLGRLAFDEKKVREIVVHGKRKDLRQGYINGYNACDGNHTVSELANIVGVAVGTLSPILKEWEELGIIYEVDKPKGKFRRKLFPI